MIEIRNLDSLADFEEAVRLEQEIWRFSDLAAMPTQWFVVNHKTGGQGLGAFDGARMVAFLAAMPAIKPDGRCYLHSHMLAVLPEYRDRGLGRRMKLRQRDDALSRGIDLVEWTFDPLELKNAFFNIERLGAVVRRYVQNQYGITASPLHGGLPTDRCVAEWWLKSRRAHGVRSTGSHTLRIAFPRDIAIIRAEDPGRAREIQRLNGERFREAFAGGLAVTGFERGEIECVYLLEPWHED